MSIITLISKNIICVSIMDEDARKELSHEEPQNSGNKKNDVDKNYRELNKITSHSTLQNNQRRRSRSRSHSRSHSRSRSPNVKSSKQGISSNAFINFLQEFREDYTGVKSSRVSQLAGERWRNMTLKEKEPYVQAAKSIRNQKQDQEKNKQVNKPKKNIEQKKTKNVKKEQTKDNKQVRRNSKGRKQNKKKRDREIDTDSAASTTADSMSSEDLSDRST
ncbi:uncharacterized protein LOC143178228 [Calliopsis andreniformis]|uniref:uncharacterized protein LOC143178228 n=1 Tax=Calliopsis andreniformis TaxID=337506 RepID=UPI003FCCA930